MPSNHQSCLLVKISSSQYGPACPPVIIKEKDGSRRAQQRHQHASLLCSERSTFSNPPAPNGPIYCTTWIVFGCTLYFQIFIWYPLSFLLPHRLSACGSVQLTESPELSGHFMAAIEQLRAQLAQMKVTHYAKLIWHTPAVRLANFSLFDFMFLFHS